MKRITTGSLNSAISENVRRMRIVRGWTQEEAGRRLGEITGTEWSNAVWSNAEKQTRDRDWTATELAALARLFHVTYDELFATPQAVENCPTCGQEVLPVSGQGATKPTRREWHSITDDHLKQVAEVYEQALAAGGAPTRTVANRFGAPHSTAAKWVGHARTRGFLPPTTPGKAVRP